MRLVKARVTNYKNIQDSGEFNLDQVTCLVGKNQSGKSALLQALYRLNPVDPQRFAFDRDRDYPKNPTARSGGNEPTDEGGERVVTATFVLDQEDISAVEVLAGSGCFQSSEPALVVQLNYADALDCELPDLDESNIIDYLTESLEFHDSTWKRIHKIDSLIKFEQFIDTEIDKPTNDDERDDFRRLKEKLDSIGGTNMAHRIWNEVLQERLPRFVYYDEYASMKALVPLDDLFNRLQSGTLRSPDLPLLGLLRLGELELDALRDDQRSSESRKNMFEAASRNVSERIEPYWSVGNQFRPEFDIITLTAGDDPDAQGQRAFEIRIKDVVDGNPTGYSTRVDQRSNGFQWMFSFTSLVGYLKSEWENCVILLDEPGVSLHGDAQAKLLAWIRSEALDRHSFAYTTHSPFMIDVQSIDNVRVVEADARSKSAVVRDNVFKMGSSDMLPLQSALGYSVVTPMLLGTNVLIVEGASDIRYISRVRQVLDQLGLASLSRQWSIAPALGVGRIPKLLTFFKAVSDFYVAVLCDGCLKDQQPINNAIHGEMIAKSNVFSIGDFLGMHGADVEDMFEPSTYLKLVNRHFGTSLEADQLPRPGERVIDRLKTLGDDTLPGISSNAFHLACAKIFDSQFESVIGELSEKETTRWSNLFERINALLETT